MLTDLFGADQARSDAAVQLIKDTPDEACSPSTSREVPAPADVVAEFARAQAAEAAKHNPDEVVGEAGLTAAAM